MAHRRALVPKIVVLACLLFLIGAGTLVRAEQASDTGAPRVVYVADFELEKSEAETEQGPLGRPFDRPGLLGRLRSGKILERSPEDNRFDVVAARPRPR